MLAALTVEAQPNPSQVFPLLPDTLGNCLRLFSKNILYDTRKTNYSETLGNCLRLFPKIFSMTPVRLSEAVTLKIKVRYSTVRSFSTPIPNLSLPLNFEKNSQLVAWL